VIILATPTCYVSFEDLSYLLFLRKGAKLRGSSSTRVDTNWGFQFIAKYDYRFLLDVIIAIIATFFAKAIIAISQLSLSILLE
jgi:hypothetical protein